MYLCIFDCIDHDLYFAGLRLLHSSAPVLLQETVSFQSVRLLVRESHAAIKIFNTDELLQIQFFVLNTVQSRRNTS